MKSRVLSLLLTIALCLTLLPAPARAAATYVATLSVNGTETKYETIDAALEAAQKASGSVTLTLLENVESASRKISLTEGKFTINLNGKALDPGVSVSNTCNLTIIGDETSSVGDIITNEQGYSISTGGENSVLTIRGGTYRNSVKFGKGTVKIEKGNFLTSDTAMLTVTITADRTSILDLLAESCAFQKNGTFLKKVDLEATEVSQINNVSVVPCTMHEEGATTCDYCTPAVPSTAVTLTDGMVTITGGAYTGAPIAPAVTVTHNSTALTAGTDYALSGTTSATDAGTYSLTVTGQGGYSGAVTKQWTITPIAAPVTTWPTVAQIYVNDTLADSALTGGVSGVDGSFSITGTKTWATAGSKTTALTFTPSDTTNYTPATQENVSVSVVKRTVSSVENLSAITGKPYGTAQSALGLPAAVTLTASGKTFENVPVTWTGYDPATTAPQTLTGALDLTAIAAEVEQGTPPVTASISVTLSAKTATAPTFSPKSVPYTGEPVTHELVKPEGVASVTYEYEGASGTDYVKSTTAPTNAGAYTVTATFTMADGYAQLDPMTSTLTITKAAFTASVSMADYTFGADVPSPRVSANPGNGTVTCYYQRADGGAAAKWENITATTLSPGTYRLHAVIAETANYQSCTTDPVEFVVAAAPAPIFPPPASPVPSAPAPSAPEPDEDEPGEQPEADEPDEQQEPDAPAAPFVDVPPEAYYADAVAWAAQNGITGGVGDDCFAPAQFCSRAQIVTFLWRAAGSPKPAGEAPLPADVPHGDYYTQAVRWAMENGIALGMGDGFRPDGACTRAQAVMFLYRCAMLRGDMAEAQSPRIPFTDVPAWCYESVAWCYAQGITSGTGEDTFSPDEICTRAQIVTLLHRFCAQQ